MATPPPSHTKRARTADDINIRETTTASSSSAHSEPPYWIRSDLKRARGALASPQPIRVKYGGSRREPVLRSRVEGSKSHATGPITRTLALNRLRGKQAVQPASPPGRMASARTKFAFSPSFVFCRYPREAYSQGALSVRPTAFTISGRRSETGPQGQAAGRCFFFFLFFFADAPAAIDKTGFPGTRCRQAGRLQCTTTQRRTLTREGRK